MSFDDILNHGGPVASGSPVRSQRMQKQWQKLTQIPPELCSLEDYANLARAVLPDDVWAYIDSGSAAEQTLQRNHKAFEGLQIWNRVLADLKHGHTRCRLGQFKLAHPIILGPVAHQKLVDPAGELATAQAAEATDSLMVVSNLASQPLAEVAAAGNGLKWFQLYWQGSRTDSHALVQRAEQAGYQAIVLTVDVPVNGVRRRIQQAGFELPMAAAAINVKTDPMPVIEPPGASEVFQGWMVRAPVWDDVAWLVKQTGLPVYLKGVLHPQDVTQARSIGVAGVVLSNHGGRALDGCPSPLDVLPLIRSVVGDDWPVLMDGGIRQGGDVFKAIARGASAVMLGRPQMHGLAVAGALGVAHLIKLLRQELEVTMALAGCATLADIDASCLFKLNEEMTHVTGD
jgi:4-hydroxymandelate oxidase